MRNVSATTAKLVHRKGKIVHLKIDKYSAKSAVTPSEDFDKTVEKFRKSFPTWETVKYFV